MATWIPIGYRPRAAKFFFYGDESKYELWEVKFLRYLRIQHLHQIILSPTGQIDDIDFVGKNATVFTELIQYLDNKSLSLVIRDPRDNGRKALTILRIKRKAESYFPLYRAKTFEKIGISLLQTI